jgi:gas vesicle structural protein
MPRRPVEKMGGASSLADVLNVILDKGIVIDAWARVSVVGIEILTIEARVVVASVETYLRYAEAIGLTALAAAPNNQGQGGSREQEAEPPSEDEILDYLSDHSEGLRLGEMEAYFNVPRRELAEVIDDMVDDDRVRRDDEHKLYYAVDEGEDEDGEDDEDDR